MADFATIFGRKTAHKAIPALNFEIFLKSPYFLRS